MKAILKYSLWLAGIGLMLSSSGVDGAYLTRIMPEGFGWLGLILNTVADLSTMVLTYWYGVLKRENSKRAKLAKMANVVLAGEAFAFAYSAFFSWRQLLIVMLPVEGEATAIIAPIAALFVPGLLAFIGFTQSLLADDSEAIEDIEDISKNAVKKSANARRRNAIAETQTATSQNSTAIAKPKTATSRNSVKPTATISQFRQWIANMNGERAQLQIEDIEAWIEGQGKKPPSDRTLYHWLEEAKGES